MGERAQRAETTSTVHVAAERPYGVAIGVGVRGNLPTLVADAARVAILHPEAVQATAEELAALVPAEVTLIGVPTSEDAKTADVLVHCWDTLAASGFTRSDLIVGLGGGATTDLAGFVAASWLRGVDFVTVPTSVLGMVDAAVGGKTGINIAAGKNLVGAFHEPRAVLCDLDLLASLPAVEVRSGLAEVVKCGFVRDPEIVTLIGDDPAESQDVGSARFAELVRRAIQVKADVVSADLREATSHGAKVGRETINYGHTLGHAIEAHEHFRWRHGEAISVGMVFAAELSRSLLHLDDAAVTLHRDLLTALGLPTSYDGATFDQLRALMSLDKKTRGTSLRFVGLPRLGSVEIIDAPPEHVLERCFEAVR